MGNLGDMVARVSADLTEFNAAMASIPDKFKEAADSAESKWAGIEALGSKLMGMGAALTAAVTAPIVGVGAAAIQLSEQLNMARLSFTTMLGSAEKAGDFLKQLQAFAASTPFEFPDLVQAAKRMTAMGFEASQVIPTLRTIGDAVAALGGGKDVIDGVTTALGQMQAKGKVSAEEMNQLAERGIPAWKLLADNIGVSIPEAMKLAEQGAIKAADAIPAILEGMNEKFGGQMQQASQTLTGVWSNFKDTVSITLADVGNILAPVLKNIVELATPLLQWVKDGVQWFAQLPSPVQNAAIAFAAMMAAIGPIALALGGIITAVSAIGTAIAPIAGVLGITTGAFLGWAAAIPVALAALVALGTWVYENWSAITAVVNQAWDGVTEAWTAAWGAIQPYLEGVWNAIIASVNALWGPQIRFFLGVWDAVGPYFKAAWDAISSGLMKTWEDIKHGISVVWDTMVKGFEVFLEIAAKFPGVNKLLNLDEAWKSAKKLEEQTRQTTDEVKKHADAHEKGAPKVKKMTEAITSVGKAAKETEDKVKPLIKRSVELDETAKQLTETYKKSVTEVVKWKLAHQDAASTTPILTATTKELDAAIQAMVSSAKLIAPAFLDAGKQATDAMRSAVKPIQDLDAAYKTLGITSTQSLKDQAAEAARAYDAIKASGTASARDLDAAWAKMEQSRIDAAKAAGETIPNEYQRELDKMLDKLDVHHAKHKTAWSDWSKQVSTIVTDLGKQLSDALWDGDKSWGEKGMNMLKSLGESVTRAFIEPAMKAIGDFISGALSDLLGGKGLGGIMDRLKDIGGAFKDVFSAGSAASSGGSGGGSIPTGGGGGGGGVGGAVASGALGWVSAIGSVGTMISSIIGNFQMAKQETSLNAIEHNTRYSMMYLGERADGGILGVLFRIQENTQYLNPLLDALNAKMDNWLDPLRGLLHGISEQIAFAQTRFDEISTNTYWTLKACQDNTELLRHTTMILSQVRDSINAQARRSDFVIRLEGGTAAERSTANSVLNQLKAQGAFI
jgi:tape measure domain-containing protein